MTSSIRLLAFACIAAATSAQRTTAPACPSTIQPKTPAPSVAGGWRADLVATNLSKPRTVLFDSEGGLLVVEPLKGISRITLDGGEGPCVRTKGDPVLMIEDESVSKHSPVPFYCPTSKAAFQLNATCQWTNHLTLLTASPRTSAFRRWKDHLCILLHRSLCVGL